MLTEEQEIFQKFPKNYREEKKYSRKTFRLLRVEPAYRVDIGGCTLYQLPCLYLVMIGEGEPLYMIEKSVPDVTDHLLRGIRGRTAGHK